MFPAGVMPVPARLKTCGLPVAESTSSRVPVRTPVAVGVKVTSTPQLLVAFGLRVSPSHQVYET
jgi:hypothetical protein